MSKELRERVEKTLQLLVDRENIREEYGKKDDPHFNESDYPSYCYIANVEFYCAPLNPFKIEQWRKEGKTVDEMMVELDGQEPTYKIAKFVPSS